MGKIIITGVDGNFGGYAAKRALELAGADKLVFTSPDRDKLRKFETSGAKLRYADFNDAAGLRSAFEGGGTLLLISMPFVGEKRRNAHAAVIDAAVDCGIDRLIYTSIVGAGVEENDAYEIADHKFTEKYIRSKGLNYVILRNSQYAEAMVSAYEEAYSNTGGVLSNNMGDGLMAFVARFDCAEAAANAAVGAGDDNSVYYISGPEAMTVSDYLRIASEVTGNDVSYRYVSDDEMYAFFDSIGVPRTTDGEWAQSAVNFPFCSEGMVTFGRAIRLGQMSNCTNDFEYLTGKKQKSVREIFQDIDKHRIGARTSTD